MKVKHFEVEIEVKEKQRDEWKKRQKRFVVRKRIVTDAVLLQEY
jgi:hypothetical protein